MYFKCIPNVFDFFARIHNEWLPKTTGKKMGDESDASEGDAMQVDEDTEMPQMNATLLKALSAHQKRCDKIRSASKNTTPQEAELGGWYVAQGSPARKEALGYFDASSFDGVPDFA